MYIFPVSFLPLFGPKSCTATPPPFYLGIAWQGLFVIICSTAKKRYRPTIFSTSKYKVFRKRCRKGRSQDEEDQMAYIDPLFFKTIKPWITQG